MSFHEELLPLLRGDLAAALSLPPEAIYAGDQPQRVTRQGLEIWVEAGPGGAALAGALTVHPYSLHVRLKTRRGPNLTGADEISAIKRALETIRSRYDGTRPFAASLRSLIAAQVEGESVSADSESGVLEGNLQLKLLEA